MEGIQCSVRNRTGVLEKSSLGSDCLAIPPAHTSFFGDWVSCSSYGLQIYYVAKADSKLQTLLPPPLTCEHMLTLFLPLTSLLWEEGHVLFKLTEKPQQVNCDPWAGGLGGGNACSGRDGDRFSYSMESSKHRRDTSMGRLELLPGNPRALGSPVWE